MTLLGFLWLSYAFTAVSERRVHVIYFGYEKIHLTVAVVQYLLAFSQRTEIVIRMIVSFHREG